MRWSSAGYEVLQAANGTDGMKEALRATYDLLLLDLILPGPSGFEILEAVRKTRATLPIIILTARGEEGDRVRGLAARRGRLRGETVQCARAAGPGRGGAAPFARAARNRRQTRPARRRGRPGAARGSLRRRQTRRTVRTRGRPAPLPRRQRRAGHLARGDPAAGLAAGSETHRNPHHRHAHRPPAREAARRPGASQGAAHRPRQGLHVCHDKS